jgi:hypothetical protein
MELFIPSIATLLIMALIVFLIIPRIGAPILAVLSIVLLSYAVYNHMQLFYPEYRYSTWQDKLKQYASFIIVGVLVLLILLYLGFIFTTQGANALPAAAVPVGNATEVVNTANTVINKAGNVAGNAAAAVGNVAGNVAAAAGNVAAAAGNVVGKVTEAVGNVANKAANVVGLGKNAGKINNKQGLLYELANIVKTPNRPNNRAV